MDINLNYVEAGSGDALILLHGNGESGAYFEHQIPYFSEKYRVIAPDTRGHGKSPRGSAPFSIKQFAEDLNSFMESIAVPSAHLLGFSDGGNIALEFALKYPEKVKKLVLNGANLCPNGVKAQYQLPIAAGYFSAKIFSPFSDRAKKNAEMLGLMVKEPKIKPESLNKLNVPALVIAGTNDMIKHGHTKLIAENIPRSKLVFINGTHFIAHDNPAEFNAEVNAFLSER